MGPVGGDDGRRGGDLAREVQSAGDSWPAAGSATSMVRAPRAHDDGGKGDGCDVGAVASVEASVTRPRCARAKVDQASLAGRSKDRVSRRRVQRRYVSA